ADLCSRKQVTAGIAATTQDVKWLVRAFARGDAPPEESHLSHGWRKEHLLPELLAFLEGKLGLYVANLKSESPLKFMDVR
ncbi:MAG: hypothetical protein K8T89_10760, partial [Planctomycetes bacterium]|nr:hypothetical protein [Planctomycetota bacterium]